MLASTFLSITGLLALATALPNPSPNASPDDLAAALACEFPTGNCTAVGTCEYCCIGDPGADSCHIHVREECGPGDAGLVYHCDLDH